MSRPFTFKQFSVLQENATFKVGTDSVILGAWAKIQHAKNILDIGTGTGLLALMCAQRNLAAQIIAIEKDEASYLDAQHNSAQSPWDYRLKVIHSSVENYVTDTKFDYIICNPPYFLNALLSPDERKSEARHVSENWFSVLAEKADSLLHIHGVFGCVLPEKEFGFLHEELIKRNFTLSRSQKLLAYPGGDKIRVLAEWRRTAENNATKISLPDIHVRNNDREFSHEYRALTQDFYLKF